MITTLSDRTVVDVVAPSVRDAIRLLASNTRSDKSRVRLALANDSVTRAIDASAVGDWRLVARALDYIASALEESALESGQTRVARQRAIRAITVLSRVSVLASRRAEFVAV